MILKPVEQSDFIAIPANLDAFLPREDFNADGNKPKINEFGEMGITELREQWVHLLRKPDFQRTTDDWDADHIMQFIKSFAEGDVIPGVIFWASPKTGNILVIDGAHRISSILAWIFDDYGDGDRSQKLFPFAENLPDFTEYGTDFSTETRSAVFLADALRGSPICRICKARYQPDSVNADHKREKPKEGTGHPKNLAPTHFYCNGGKRTFNPLIRAAWRRIKERCAPTQKLAE